MTPEEAIKDLVIRTLWNGLHPDTTLRVEATYRPEICIVDTETHFSDIMLQENNNLHIAGSCKAHNAALDANIPLGDPDWPTKLIALYQKWLRT